MRKGSSRRGSKLRGVWSGTLDTYGFEQPATSGVASLGKCNHQFHSFNSTPDISKPSLQTLFVSRESVLGRELPVLFS